MSKKSPGNGQLSSEDKALQTDPGASETSALAVISNKMGPMALDILTPSERQKFLALAKQRADTIIRAIRDQCTQSVDSIIEQLRIEKNLILSSDQLEQLIKDLQEQIKAEVSKHIAKLRADVETKVAEVKDSFQNEKNSLEERHRKELEELRTKQKRETESFVSRRGAAIDEVESELRNAESSLTKQHCADLLAKLTKYRSDLVYTKEQDMIIAQRAQTQFNLIKSSQGRLNALISDFCNRVQEQMMFASTRGEAKLCIDRIPSISQVMSLIVRGPQGIVEFMRQLCPEQEVVSPEEKARMDQSRAAAEAEAAKAPIEIIDADAVGAVHDEYEDRRILRTMQNRHEDAAEAVRRNHERLEDQITAQDMTVDDDGVEDED